MLCYLLQAINSILFLFAQAATNLIEPTNRPSMAARNLL